MSIKRSNSPSRVSFSLKKTLDGELLFGSPYGKVEDSRNYIIIAFPNQNSFDTAVQHDSLRLQLTMIFISTFCPLNTSLPGFFVAPGNLRNAGRREPRFLERPLVASML